jgi:hypothetical protein
MGSHEDKARSLALSIIAKLPSVPLATKALVAAAATSSTSSSAASVATQRRKSSVDAGSPPILPDIDLTFVGAQKSDSIPLSSSDAAVETVVDDDKSSRKRKRPFFEHPAGITRVFAPKGDVGADGLMLNYSQQQQGASAPSSKVDEALKHNVLDKVSEAAPAAPRLGAPIKPVPRAERPTAGTIVPITTVLVW